MKTLAIYCRVSTEEQAKKGLSLNDQEKRGIEHAKKLKCKHKVFRDEGISGTIKLQDRIGMNSLIQEIQDEEKQYIGVYVTDIDRIARNPIESFTFYKLLKDNNLLLYDVSGIIALQDENEELMVNIKSIFAAFEIKKTSNRIKRVLERNAIEGNAGGGPILPYGYNKDINKKLIINEDEAEIVREIFQLSILGHGTKVIANFLNDEKIPTKRGSSQKGYMKVRGELKSEFKWRDSVIYRILTNTMYYGKRKYKNIVVECPSIIDKNVFDTVQKQLMTRKNFKNTKNKYHYLLKGLVFCTCGRRFYGRKRIDLKDNQYICASQRYPGEFCGTRGLNIDFLNKLVWMEVLNLPKQLDKYFQWFEKEGIIKESMKAMTKCLSSLENLERRKTKLFELYEEGKIDRESITNRINQIEIDISLTKENIQKFASQTRYEKDKELILEYVKKNLLFASKVLTDEFKQIIIRALVDKIELKWIQKDNKHMVKIHFKIDKSTSVLMARNLEVRKESRKEHVLRRELTATTNVIIPEGKGLFHTKRFTDIDNIIEWEKEKNKFLNY